MHAKEVKLCASNSGGLAGSMAMQKHMLTIRTLRNNSQVADVLFAELKIEGESHAVLIHTEIAAHIVHELSF